MICSCTSRGSWPHTCSGPKMELSRKVAPGTAYSTISNFSRKPNWWQATKLALVTRYCERMGRGPKRRWLTVTEPDFLES